MMQQLNQRDTYLADIYRIRQVLLTSNPDSWRRERYGEEINQCVDDVHSWVEQRVGQEIFAGKRGVRVVWGFTLSNRLPMNGEFVDISLSEITITHMDGVPGNTMYFWGGNATFGARKEPLRIHRYQAKALFDDLDELGSRHSRSTMQQVHEFLAGFPKSEHATSHKTLTDWNVEFQADSSYYSSGENNAERMFTPTFYCDLGRFKVIAKNEVEQERSGYTRTEYLLSAIPNFGLLEIEETVRGKEVEHIYEFLCRNHPSLRVNA